MTERNGQLQQNQNVGTSMESDVLEEAVPRLASPARRALAGAGYTRLTELAQVSEAEILQLHGMGPKALGQLREALAARGLAFNSDD